MQASNSHARSSPPTRRARNGDVEGYLSLTATIFLLVLPPLLPSPPRPFGAAIGISGLALALVLGLSGIRSGRGGGRVAAWVSTVVISSLMLAALVIAWH